MDEYYTLCLLLASLLLILNRFFDPLRDVSLFVNALLEYVGNTVAQKLTHWYHFRVIRAPLRCLARVSHVFEVGAAFFYSLSICDDPFEAFVVRPARFVCYVTQYCFWVVVAFLRSFDEEVPTSSPLLVLSSQKSLFYWILSVTYPILEPCQLLAEELYSAIKLTVNGLFPIVTTVIFFFVLALAKSFEVPALLFTLARRHKRKAHEERKREEQEWKRKEERRQRTTFPVALAAAYYRTHNPLSRAPSLPPRPSAPLADPFAFS